MAAAEPRPALLFYAGMKTSRVVIFAFLSLYGVGRGGEAWYLDLGQRSVDGLQKGGWMVIVIKSYLIRK